MMLEKVSETQMGIKPMNSDYASGAVPSELLGLTSSFQLVTCPVDYFLPGDPIAELSCLAEPVVDELVIIFIISGSSVCV